MENYDSIDHFVYFVENNSNKSLFGNYKEFFELLGIIDKLLIVNKPTTFKEVIVPQKAYDRHKKYYYKEFLSVFNTIIKNASEITANDNNLYEKVFLTRSSFANAKRLEFGMDMLDDFFQKNGYIIISPETIELNELIKYLNNAKEVACVSGTLPHNMMFSNGKAHLTIIERYCINNDIQVDINRMKDLNVTYVDANMCIYPVEISYGPFLFVYNRWLKQYSQDKEMIAPDSKFILEKNKKHLYRMYRKMYKQDHYESVYMPSWMQSHTKMICEAYYESEEYFYDYLYGLKPYKFSQFFSLRIIKRKIKKFFKGKMR